MIIKKTNKSKDKNKRRLDRRKTGRKPLIAFCSTLRHLTEVATPYAGMGKKKKDDTTGPADNESKYPCDTYTGDAYGGDHSTIQLD